MDISPASQQINTLRGNTFRLITLGRIALVAQRGEEDDSLSKRRLKLALLVVLALSKRPLSRDALVEMFWGDQDEARARHSLSDALSHLRRVLGRDAISTRQAEVELTADALLAVDALEFVAAAEARDYARAAALYGGPFLEAVYVAGSGSFTGWVERERKRLEGLFLKVCEGQCMLLARTRKWEECGSLAARWLDAAPLSTDAALYRLNALKAPGTRDADQRAIEEFERLTRRLSDEYGRSPDRSVAALARDIAERLAASDATGDFKPVKVLGLAGFTPPKGTPASGDANGQGSAGASSPPLASGGERAARAATAAGTSPGPVLEPSAVVPVAPAVPFGLPSSAGQAGDAPPQPITAAQPIYIIPETTAEWRSLRAKLQAAQRATAAGVNVPSPAAVPPDAVADPAAKEALPPRTIGNPMRRRNRVRLLRWLIPAAIGVLVTAIIALLVR